MAINLVIDSSTIPYSAKATAPAPRAIAVLRSFIQFVELPRQSS